MTGIDYGIGKANIDTNGVRYGILSANTPSLSEWFWEDVESVYTARCPKCGNDATGLDTIDECTDGWEEAEYDCCDKGCVSCEYLFGESGYGDEPDCNKLSREGYEGFVDEHNDIWVTKSPYRTFGRFCSPCAPGAVTMGSDGEAECYCLGTEFFTDSHPPYSVWKVVDGEYVIVHDASSEKV